MSDQDLLHRWVRRFLLEHLVVERNLARNTQKSYRDTLIVLLPFLAQTTKKPIERLCVEDLSADRVRYFLEHVEKQRRCSGATRNLRLAAIHSLARFIGAHSPEHLVWSSAIRAVPFKKVTHAPVVYLEKAEIEALLAAPDRRTAQGARDFAMLLFLYNTGARADEAAHAKVGDLSMRRYQSVQLLGKGSKIRRCPLWPQTVQVLEPLIHQRGDDEYVFLNRLGEPMTRFGIHALVARMAARARMHAPSLQRKRVSPHSIRHTSAVHMLRSGVDINTIRAFLGHVSLDTTHIYAEVDLEMKTKALGLCDIPEIAMPKRRLQRYAQTIQFLKSL